jgi:signal transduction histidine kinase
VVATFERSRLRGPELLRAVAEGTAREVGEAFLHGLVRSVAEALAAKLVLVAEATDPDGIHVKVVAGWYDGAPIEEPFEYDTAGQPCALVPGQTLVSFPEGLVRHFPEDQGAVEMGLESYLAVCLRDSQSTYLGHLAVLDSHRMEAEPEDVAVLKIFAARAGAELERRNQAAALQASRARVIEAADAERRRMGRDLHDGAQ